MLTLLVDHFALGFLRDCVLQVYVFLAKTESCILKSCVIILFQNDQILRIVYQIK